MNQRTEHNIRIFAINSKLGKGFDIYLDFSGQREWLMHYHRNALLFCLLNEGIRLTELRRWKPNKLKSMPTTHYFRALKRSTTTKLENSVSYLLKVIDNYLYEENFEDVS